MDRVQYWLNKLTLQERSGRLTPPVLPRQRPRALTPPLAGTQTSAQRQNDLQEQSAFFQKLSPEIRLLIYRAILGDRSVHVVCEHWGSSTRLPAWELWSVVCRDPRFPISGDGCREMADAGRELSPPRHLFPKVDPLILLSCCRAYSEGIDLLYSTNEFRFHDFFTLRLFPSLVLPQRFARITAIAFSWRLPLEFQPHTSTSQQANYDEVWEFLASSCPGLRKLRVFLQAPGLSSCGDKTAEEFQRAWLEPINKLESLKLQNFDVYAPKSFYFYFKDVANRKLYRLVEVPHQGLVHS